MNAHAAFGLCCATCISLFLFAGMIIAILGTNDVLPAPHQDKEVGKFSLNKAQPNAI
jgi:hypothetical protein